MPGEPVHDTSAAPAVRGFLHRPAAPSGDAIVLTHGAGGDSNAPLLLALAEAFVERGWAVLRCDLPYRQARATGPPRATDQEDRAGLKRAVELTQRHAGRRVFLGGISYGGRQATMLAADEPQLVAGLLVLSYPLHPPGRPERLRTAHLPRLRVPALFVSGDKDSFGSPEELRAAMRLLPGGPELLLVEGVGHDLGYGRRVKPAAARLPQRITATFLELASPPPSGVEDAAARR